MTDQVEFRARPAAWLARVAVALVFAGALAACDTADYTVDWFDDDDEEETAAAEDGSGAEGGSQQPTDRPFPNLSSVPERPGPPEIKLEAVSVKEGLTADKNNARYTDQVLRSQTANVRPRPRVEKPADKPPSVAAATAPKTPEPQAAPAAPAPAPQVPARAGTTTLVATIYFADGQTSLTQDDLTVLQQVMDIQRQGGGMVRVVGHSSMSSGIADPMRRRMVNFKVSLDRATIVAQSFRDMGLPGDRVAVEALGDAQPIYSEETAAGAAGNRRAEIFLDF